MAAYVATTFRLHGRDPLLHPPDHDRRRASTTPTRRWCWSPTAARSFRPTCGSGRGIRPDDGLLDVVVLRANGFARAFARCGTCSAWRRGAPAARTASSATPRGREVRVETDPVEPVELDGEPRGETPFTATVVPGAIRILVPLAAIGLTPDR